MAFTVINGYPCFMFPTSPPAHVVITVRPDFASARASHIGGCALYAGDVERGLPIGGLYPPTAHIGSYLPTTRPSVSATAGAGVSMPDRKRW